MYAYTSSVVADTHTHTHMQPISTHFTLPVLYTLKYTHTYTHTHMDMQIMNAPFPTHKHILWFTSSGWHPLLKMENSHGSDVSVSVQRYVSFTDAKGWGPVDRWVEGNSNDCVFCRGRKEGSEMWSEGVTRWACPHRSVWKRESVAFTALHYPSRWERKSDTRDRQGQTTSSLYAVVECMENENVMFWTPNVTKVVQLCFHRSR